MQPREETMEDEFRRLHAESLALPDEILLVPRWPMKYTLHDAGACGDPIALEQILFNLFNDPYSDSSDSDSDDEERIMRFLNDTDAIGRTPLHWACMVEHEQRSTECVNQLIEAGARCDLADNNDDCPVHLCVHGGGIQLLAEQRINLGRLDARARTPLMRAVERGNTGVVNFLVNVPWVSSAKINDIDIDQQTALIIACSKGYQQIVAMLLPHVDLLKGNPPPIVVATKNNHIDIIRLLATRGTDALLTTDSNEWSALHWASDMGNLEAVEELRALSPALMPIFGIQKEKEKNKNNKTNKDEPIKETDLPNIPTPLELAIARGHLHIVKCFMNHLEYGSSIAVAQGYTGSQYGVYGTWQAALKVLESIDPMTGESEYIEFSKKVSNFRIFQQENWQAAEQYVELRSYAKKRDEEIVARLEKERIAAEQEAIRKAKIKEEKAKAKAIKKKEREEKARLEGGKIGRGRKGKGRSKSPDRRGRSSKSPENKRGRSKSPKRKGKNKRTSKSPERKEGSDKNKETRGKKREGRRRKRRSKSPKITTGEHSQSLLDMSGTMSGVDMSGVDD